MANAFDQFDTMETAAPKTAAPKAQAAPANAFDQFDAPIYTKKQAALAGAVMGATAGTALPVAAYATSRAPMDIQYDPMGNVISATPTDNSGPSYEEQGANLRQQLTDIRQQQPGAYLAGNVAGAVLSPVNKVGGLVKGAGTLATVGRGALTGATYGGISGGAETGTPVGALTGAALGGTVGGVGSGIAQAGKGVVNQISASEISRRINQALQMPKDASVAVLRQMFPELEKQSGKAVQEAALKYQAALLKDPAQMARFGIQDTNPQTWAGALGTTATQMGTGAALGYGTGLVTGQDPNKLALAGAIGTPLLGRAIGTNMLPIIEKGAIKLSNSDLIANTPPAVGSFARGLSSGVTSVLAPTTLQEANQALADLFK
jgi:hypothetical protein